MPIINQQISVLPNIKCPVSLVIVIVMHMAEIEFWLQAATLISQACNETAERFAPPHSRRDDLIVRIQYHSKLAQAHEDQKPCLLHNAGP